MTSKKEATNTVTPTLEQTSPLNTEMFVLEQKKVKALEKIANSLDALTVWFEEVDKDEWGQRIQWYLSEFHKLVPSEETKEIKKTESNA
jgi:hypothetical protein